MKPEEILKSINVALSERLSSPLLASFCISWCLWNYKFIVILFSNASVLTTFSLIDKVCFPSFFVFITNGIFFPLLTALTYIYLYPYPAKYIYDFHRKKQKELQDIKNKYDDEKPLPAEQARQLRINIRELHDEYTKELMAKDQEINDLKLELKNSSKTTKFEEVLKPDNNNPTESQRLLLQSIARSTSATQVSKLLSSGNNRVAAEYDLDKLEEYDLVHRDYGSYDGILYCSLTPSGRAYLVENHLI